jgi:checkpoint serine/threonine-protein kinase
MMLAPSSSTSSSATTNPVAAPAVKRKILGDATKKSSDTPASTPAPAPSLAPTPQSTSRSNARLEVFVDDESGGVGSGTAANSWPELGTRATRTKENVQEVKKMAGTTLKQKGSKSRATPTSTASSSRGGSTFSVFTGPEEDDPPAPSIPASKSGQSTSVSAPKRALGSKSGSTVPSRTSSSGGNGNTFSVFTGSEDDPPPRTTSTTETNSEQSGGGFVPFCDDEDNNNVSAKLLRLEDCR